MLRSGFELKHAFIVSGEGIVAASMSLRVPLSTAAMSLPAAFCHARPSSHGRPARSGVPVYSGPAAGFPAPIGPEPRPTSRQHANIPTKSPLSTGPNKN